MADGNETRTSLNDYLAVLRRRKSVVVLAVLLVPLAAVLLSKLQEPQYEASSLVLLKRQSLAATVTGSQDPGMLQDPELVGRTQARVAEVTELAENVLKATGLNDRSPGALLAATTVVPLPQTDVVLKFIVQDRDPAIAARLAAEYAEQYTVYRRRLDTEAYNAARLQLEHRIAGLRRSGVDSNSGLYQTLVEKQQTLATLAALQISNASVLRRPAGAAQVAPRTFYNAVLGLMVGLVLGVGLAFLLEALDRRVRPDEDLASLLRLPLLARLPAPPRQADARELAMMSRADTPEAEAFRRLRANLELADVGFEPRTIMVTSASRGEGKSTTVANLAVALARAGRNVALVDLDVRKPTLGAFFGFRGRPGVTQVAGGNVALEDALVRVPLSVVRGLGEGRGGAAPTGTLDVLGVGSIPANPGEFIGSEGVARALDALSAQYDVVLVDTPPLLVVSDAVVLSRRVDAAIVVVRLNLTDREMLAELAAALRTCPCAMLGYVVTGAESYEAYGYGYGYAATPAQAPDPDRDPASTLDMPAALRTDLTDRDSVRRRSSRSTSR
jgi:capsular exopolysaccharide synthesis family protein